MIAKSRPISHIITDHLVEGSSFDQSGAYAIVHAVPQSLYEEPDTPPKMAVITWLISQVD